jgi:hypothetical protein
MKGLVAHTILQWSAMPMEMEQYDTNNSISCDINNPIEIGKTTRFKRARNRICHNAGSRQVWVVLRGVSSEWLVN